ncbi:MAG TPA: CDP-alcohol phosphatidyltransferase family protein [Thermohalobaculum sp.]|nr:CDP-alcohol phosphatidyltransferase family protein [Thermohalobaculum sp.]
MASGKVLIVRAAGPAAFGLTPRERLERLSARQGLELTEDPAQAGLIVRGDQVYGAAVFNALAASAPGTVLVDGHGRALAARVDGPSRDWARALLDTATPGAGVPEEAAIVDAATLAGRHNLQLSKRLAPLLMPATDRGAMEKALFRESYKGVTDLVTKHVWPPLAFAATRWCARRGLTPNQVTLVSAALVALAFWLFWEGQFALGLIAAWTMTLLDTVDGKLARVTLRSSPFGDIFDHGIDLIHPPFWYWAWIMGLAAQGMALGDGGLILALIVGGYVLQRLEEGLFIHLFGMQIHVWQRFDSLFRQITARRNPNLLILTVATILGAPDQGIVVVAGWTVFCLLVHLARIVQALAARRAGPLVSWLAQG